MSEEYQEEKIQVESNIETDHIVQYTKPKKSTEKPKPMSNVIQVVLNPKSRIEIINTQTGQRSNMVPANGKIKLNNTNVYNINISNDKLNLDEMNAVKTFSKYAEFFQILTVQNGYVTIKSIVSGLDLKDGMEIGTII
jgi:hypothetical protein